MVAMAHLVLDKKFFRRQTDAELQALEES